MRIGGAAYYQDVSYINSLRGREMNIPKVDPEQVKLQDQKLTEEKSNPLSQSSIPVSPEAEERRAGRIADLEDISLSFNREDDFGYIGRDSDIFKLDVEKAISDMKRDSVLEEYQYFVGNSRMLQEQQSSDAIVIPKMIFA